MATSGSRARQLRRDAYAKKAVANSALTGAIARRHCAGEACRAPAAGYRVGTEGAQTESGGHAAAAVADREPTQFGTEKRRPALIRLVCQVNGRSRPSNALGVHGRLPRGYSRFGDAHPGRHQIGSGRLTVYRESLTYKQDLFRSESLNGSARPDANHIENERQPGTTDASGGFHNASIAPKSALRRRRLCMKTCALPGTSRMEPTGFEPVTSCLQSRRSPN
jgi:hypothetical protein